LRLRGVFVGLKVFMGFILIPLENPMIISIRLQAKTQDAI